MGKYIKFQIEIKVILAKILQKFDFHLDMEQSFDIMENAVLKPKDGTRCCLSPRNSAHSR